MGAPLLLQGCNFLEELERGNGHFVTERRAPGDFRELKIGGNFEVFLQEGEEPYIEINTDENLLDFIDVSIKDSKLLITQEKKLISKRKIELVINYREIEKIRVMGAALVKNQGYLENESLELRMEGAGIMNLKVKSEDLRVLLSGAGVVELSGKVYRQELNLTGAGKLEAMELESKECKISVGGLGGAEIFVTEKLEARIEGIGGIEYDGDPEEVITEINGLGKIKRSGD